MDAAASPTYPERGSGPAQQRRMLWVGLAIVLLSGVLPHFAYRLGRPGVERRLGWDPSHQVVLIGDPDAAQRTPYRDLGQGAWAALVGDEGVLTALWHRRVVYPYALVPLWIALLLLARRRTRLASWLGMALGVGIVVLEAAYLRSDYLELSPHVLGRLEVGIIWSAIVLLVLVIPWRSGRRPEAILGAHGALALLHALTLPCTAIRDRIPDHGVGELLGMIAERFGPGFWLGLLGTSVMALALFTRGPALGAPTRASRSRG